MNLELLDHELRFPQRDVCSRFRYAAIFGAGAYRLRVRVNVEVTRRESSAVVEVLSAFSTWTVLIDAEPPQRVPGEFVRDKVEALARGLVERAIAVLPRVEAAGGER